MTENVAFEPREQGAVDPREGLALAGADVTGAGRHRGPVAEHDEEAAPRGRHRREP
ncbi:hypothetical protein ABT390_03215 [Streptomyces aurantiacus]|uniref:Uncharacterized protein n=1 Tax=Streptomyces aurantiacus JA 4570 TaxID=1286094 RepID=S4A1H1_9ACTN|nr:hypothetical protein [Streptomyces aurantiacus]EPH44530.1 hypothetical protein STRAU_2412 [Streptomyces aurantiacus JA 4570]